MNFFEKIKSVGKIFVVGYVLVSALAIAGGVLSFPGLYERIMRLDTIEKKTSEDRELGKFVSDIMSITNSKLTEFQRDHLVQAVVRVTGKTFETLEERKTFAVLVSIESKFNRQAKSSAGAIGLSQVITKYAESFGDKCGYKGVTPDDLFDGEMNMTVGACQFKDLLKALGGNTSAALVAYNAGQSSESLKQIKRLSNISNPETVNYVSRFSYVKDEARARALIAKGEE